MLTRNSGSLKLVLNVAYIRRGDAVDQSGPIKGMEASECVYTIGALFDAVCLVCTCFCYGRSFPVSHVCTLQLRLVYVLP